MVSVQLPQTGISIGELSRVMRRAFGNETYITGSLVRGPGEALSLTVRGTGVPPRTFTGPREQLPQLTMHASEYIYGRFEPRASAPR